MVLTLRSLVSVFSVGLWPFSWQAEFERARQDCQEELDTHRVGVMANGDSNGTPMIGLSSLAKKSGEMRFGGDACKVAQPKRERRG